MEFSQVVANRHSVRDFTDQPVSREDLVDIVRTAQQAPSWVNSQPWRVYAATGATLAGIKKRHAADVAAGKEGKRRPPGEASYRVVCDHPGEHGRARRADQCAAG